MLASGGGFDDAAALSFYHHSGLDQAIQRDICPPLTVGSAVPVPPAVLAGGRFDDAPVPLGLDSDRERARALTTSSQRLDLETENFAMQSAGVRRLTPLECERLQGLPDGWTCLCGGVTTAACTCPDGPRYRAIGNGGVVPCVEWIARRIIQTQRASEAA